MASDGIITLLSSRVQIWPSLSQLSSLTNDHEWSEVVSTYKLKGMKYIQMDFEISNQTLSIYLYKVLEEGGLSRIHVGFEFEMFEMVK